MKNLIFSHGRKTPDDGSDRDGGICRVLGWRYCRRVGGVWMKKIKVKITGHTAPMSWYRLMIGEVIEVYDYRPNTYIVAEDYDGHKIEQRLIYKPDAKEVKDAQ